MFFDRYGNGLGDIGTLHQSLPAGGFNRVLSNRDLVRFAPTLAGADVELPAMPGAADDFTRAFHAVLAGAVSQHKSGQQAFAQAAALATAMLERENISPRRARDGQLHLYQSSISSRHILQAAEWDPQWHGGNQQRS